jgi:hypothetical protein
MAPRPPVSLLTRLPGRWKGAPRPDPAPGHATYHRLPLTAIRPESWLRNTLERLRDGLGGHPEVAGYPYDTDGWAAERLEASAQTWWPYEQTAYAVDGQLRLGHLLAFAQIERTFADGDRVVLDLPLCARARRWPGDGVAVERGPLVFSLPVPTRARPVPDYVARGRRRSTAESPAWELEPAGEWRFGVCVDEESPIDVIARSTHDDPWAAGSAPVRCACLLDGSTGGTSPPTETRGLLPPRLSRPRASPPARRRRSSSSPTARRSCA